VYYFKTLKLILVYKTVPHHSFYMLNFLKQKWWKFSKGLWQRVIHYTTFMLDAVQCLWDFDIHDDLEVDSTFILRQRVIITVSFLLLFQH
jgi:hypothetical protein